VPGVEGALGYWSAANVAPVMTAADFETSAEAAQRWLASCSLQDTSGSWRAALTVGGC
jgi:hypothetical protein